MKISLAALTLVMLAGCEINHRSDDYACTKNIDCPSGRTCSDGFCILAGAIDAARADAVRGDAAQACPPACTSCNVAEKSCTIDCEQGSCTNTITCPAGYNCNILCNTNSSCRGGVNCLASASCTIECSGGLSCRGIQCGPGPCDVSCSGPSSCRNVVCGTSCACDVTCTGNQSCTQGIVCTSASCRRLLGCTSAPTFCHSCD